MRSYSRISGTSSLESVTRDVRERLPQDRRPPAARESGSRRRGAGTRRPPRSPPTGSRSARRRTSPGSTGSPHRAVDQHALVHLEAQVARRERPRPLHEQVVHVVAVLAGDLDRVAEALGRDQRGPGALPLDDGVGDERGAVEDVGHAGRRARAPRPSTASIPATTASSGRSGVVSTLPTWKVWPSSLARMRSVNVPPISDPTRYKVTPSGKSKSGSGPDFGFRRGNQTRGLTPFGFEGKGGPLSDRSGSRSRSGKALRADGRSRPASRRGGSSRRARRSA